jgi:putative flippase GtrA
MNRINMRHERIRFYKFLAVGTLGAVVDFFVMNLLTQLFKVSLLLAGSISFICAVVSNFFWNRFWTYPDSRSKPISLQLGMFFIVNLLGIVIRIPILRFFEPLILDILGKIDYPFNNPSILAKNLTLAIAIGIVLLWNFFVNRFWTYNDIDKVMT